MNRKCGPIPAQARTLPDYVPDIIKARYNRETDTYRHVIHRLLDHSLADLKRVGVYIPVWRYEMGKMAQAI